MTGSAASKDPVVTAFNDRQRKRRLVTCQHFTGRDFNGESDKCAKGICYGTVVGAAPYSISCIRNEHWIEGDRPACSSYEARTEAQVDAEEARQARAFELLGRGLSECCEAPIDESQVISTPPHIGHGPRFCSKCKRVAFWV
jgi:hypothetical protein